MLRLTILIRELLNRGYSFLERKDQYAKDLEKGFSDIPYHGASP